METQKQEIKKLCNSFRLSGIATHLDKVITESEKEKIGFAQYTMRLLEAELEHRQQRDQSRRMKAANLPRNHDLDRYQATGNGLSVEQLAQLRELNWIDQLFNMVLLGPSGTGKTMLAAGLAKDAIRAGYKAYFKTMEDIVTILKTKEFAKTKMTEYKKLVGANLLVLDDIMLFPLEKNVAISFFNFINQIYENTSIIITTNKKPSDWAKMLEDEVLATALLDRLLFRAEIINLTGESYRMKNRKSFFEQTKE